MIVEAYNYNDARSIAESSTGGKLINATPKYGAEISDDNSSNSSSSLDVLLPGSIFYSLVV
jgi:hypothetical protein